MRLQKWSEQKNNKDFTHFAWRLHASYPAMGTISLCNLHSSKCLDMVEMIPGLNEIVGVHSEVVRGEGKGLGWWRFDHVCLS